MVTTFAASVIVDLMITEILIAKFNPTITVNLKGMTTK